MAIIEVKGLKKSYGNINAVNGVDFAVQAGEIFGFLGPNGAGKSTTIKILATLLKATGGSASIKGFDVVKAPNQVRKCIGMVFQDHSLDDRLSARENLWFHGMLYNLDRPTMNRRILEVLEMVELKDREKSLVKTFSGGMKRRLEIARGLLHYPDVLFLDEPTVGLDPQTRSKLWDYIHQLQRRESITIFMTTHYMDEAENCQRIAIMDHGRIVALDTPTHLKKTVGGDIITLSTLDDRGAAQIIKQKFNLEAGLTANGLTLEVDRGEYFIPDLAAELKGLLTSVSLRPPTLDDVFLKITGREIREEEVRQKVMHRGRHRR